jgi:hypothetical protein
MDLLERLWGIGEKVVAKENLLSKTEEFKNYGR